MRKTVKRLICLCLAIGMMFSVVGLPASAYNLNPDGIYISNKLIFVMDSTFSDTSKLHMSLGLSQWNYAAGKSLTEVSSGVHYGYTTYPNPDGNSYVYKDDAGTLYVGETYIRTNSSSHIIFECDININTHYEFANSAQKGKYDTYSVLLHESGHVIGLKHSEYSSAVMWKALGTGITKRDLTTDDKNGAKAIYGNK